MGRRRGRLLPYGRDGSQHNVNQCNQSCEHFIREKTRWCVITKTICTKLLFLVFTLFSSPPLTTQHVFVFIHESSRFFTANVSPPLRFDRYYSISAQHSLGLCNEDGANEMKANTYLTYSDESMVHMDIAANKAKPPPIMAGARKPSK